MEGDAESSTLRMPDGEMEGDAESSTVGITDGEMEGDAESSILGITDGEIDGEFKGDTEGSQLGLIEGEIEGEFEGDTEGSQLGLFEGEIEGEFEGEFDGNVEGSPVIIAAAVRETTEERDTVPYPNAHKAFTVTVPLAGIKRVAPLLLVRTPPHDPPSNVAPVVTKTYSPDTTSRDTVKLSPGVYVDPDESVVVPRLIRTVLSFDTVTP